MDEAETYIPKVLSVAEQSGSKIALAQALITRGLIEDRRGKSEQAIATLRRAVSLGEQANHPFSVSRARNNLAYVLIKLGRNIEAAEQLEYMLAYSRRVNSIFGELWYLSEINILYLDLGRIDEVIALVPAMMDLLKNSGGKAYRAQVVGARLQVLVYTGKPEEAISDLRAERDDLLRHNDKQMVMVYSHTLALAYTIMQDYNRAAQEVEFGIQTAGIWGGASDQYLLAKLQASSDADISIARESFKRGEEIVESPPTFVDMSTRQYALMHIRAREENYTEALSIAAELAEKYRSVQFRWLSAFILWEAGEIALKASDRSKANELLMQAENEYKEIHIPMYAAQIETLRMSIV